MESNDIHISIRQRVTQMAGGMLFAPFVSKEEKAEYFKRAIFDYSCEKLLEIDENKVIVDDIEFIFSRLDKQFSWEGEQEAFYKNYAYCILWAYGVLTGTKLTWEDVSIDESGEFPKITEGRFRVTPATSYEEAAIWLFREYEKQLQTPKVNQRK